MSKFFKRRSGSMFKWYFVQTTVSVLVCLTISSFSVLFFFLNFWKDDRLTALNNDALSVAQSVSLIYEAVSDKQNTSDLYFTDEQIQKYISEIAVHSNTNIFIGDKNGKILLCFDDDDFFNNLCLIHSYMKFPDEIIEGIRNYTDGYYNYTGSISELYDENYLLSAVAIDSAHNYFVIIMQAESFAVLPYATEFLRSMILAGIIGVFISFVLALMISYRMVRPLKKITAATKQYSIGDFSARINTADVYDELSELVYSVNVMADSLAVLEESRSSFVANVSHELKTPMTIISGFVDGILDGTISNEETEKYLGIVSEEVKRLSRLVVAMLNMSKIEAGKLDINLNDIEIRDILMKTLLGFEKYINDKKIDIIGLDSMEDAVVKADEALITQVIYNLIDNAVKFTPEKGTIMFFIQKDKKDAVIIIRNTGKGISHEECGLVFDRFYKVDKSRGLDSKSFGLGLYIVKSIIELNKGTITINSEIDKYTEFIIKLPLA